MIKVITAYIVLWLFNALLNQLRLISTKRMHQRYLEYLSNNTYEFVQHKSKIISLFRAADLKDFGVHFNKYISPTQFYPYRVSGFENLTVVRQDVISHIKKDFEEAKGVFHDRRNESLNPLHWILFIVELPKKLVGYLGLNVDNKPMNLIQVIYWIAMIFIGLIQADIINL